ncbi:adenosyl-hopene transferase HpnH [Pendulispora albinea]|uniref:Adenosyl-hopene transferase HpnH n=1 Tax=Pendulispora albinea TaxID=2741071 RepID=A0ABZ2M6Q5_9BACT
MAIPMKQAAAVGKYILTQKLKGRKRYPLVTMLEPLFRCNLECIGCGKIQYPEEILKKTVTPEKCFWAVEECGAPVVTVAGGEPLIHPQIGEIVDGLVDRQKFVYLCTNAILLRRKLDMFKPSDYLTMSIHLDGVRNHHDECVSREGVYDTAVAAIKEAKKRGFRVTTNTTIFEGHPAKDLHKFFDDMMELGVDGMMISPGYSYERAPVQDKFLKRNQTKALFREVLAPAKERKWTFNHSPFYLDFLQGDRDYECTPWGNPNYTIFGWQRPCYLMSEGGYTETFKELMETTPWEKYGTKSGNRKCRDCMVHCGYEPTAVEDSMASPKNIYRSITAAFM